MIRMVKNGQQNCKLSETIKKYLTDFENHQRSHDGQKWPSLWIKDRIRQKWPTEVKKDRKVQNGQ